MFLPVVVLMSSRVMMVARRRMRFVTVRSRSRMMVIRRSGMVLVMLAHRCVAFRFVCRSVARSKIIY